MFAKPPGKRYFDNFFRVENVDYIFLYQIKVIIVVDLSAYTKRVVRLHCIRKTLDQTWVLLTKVNEAYFQQFYCRTMRVQAQDFVQRPESYVCDLRAPFRRNFAYWCNLTNSRIGTFPIFDFRPESCTSPPTFSRTEKSLKLIL